MNAGDAFYSKSMKRNVIFIGQGRFVGLGYRVENYLLEHVEPLEPLVRDCHYQAAVKSNDRFVTSMTAAMLHDDAGDSAEFHQGWAACVGYVADQLWASEDAASS